MYVCGAKRKGKIFNLFLYISVLLDLLQTTCIIFVV